MSVGSEIFPMMGGKVNHTVIKCSPSLYFKSQQTLKITTSAVSIHCVPLTPSVSSLFLQNSFLAMATLVNLGGIEIFLGDGTDCYHLLKQ